ncbi:MAG: hypothetical protein HY259_05265, partial [Chloroflexi bacterium]|nr:hypothetical protein [Chloroflexota bacterium]
FASLEEFIAFICGHPCYVLKDGDAFRPYQRPFTHYLAKHGPDFQTYLWHEHYTWNSARARTEHSTIEIRPACQQPQSESLAASALSLGFVEAAPAIAEYVERVLGVDPWPTMLRYRKAVIHDGLRAQEPVKKFLSSLVQEAENGLRRRGRGEETFLGPIWARLEERRAPADRARALFVKKGMPALIEACRWNNTD